VRRGLVLLAMAAGIAAAWLATATPSPRDRDAPASSFSAARAMKDVRAIAVRPHPSGSAELERVRGYIAGRLQAMGLAAEIQNAEGVLTAGKRKPGVVIAGRVHNVIGILPGRDRTAPSVLVMSHYDTMPNTPGAGDNTAGTASSLEIARALQAERPLARDVIFLHTDGEEPGLLGAQAFFAEHPLARNVGIVVNMEARGDSGRAAMFETSTDAGALVRLLGGVAPQPTANSLMAELYRRMPNDTDLSVALDQGKTGLNFAFVGDQLAYHTSISTPDDLDPGSLQHMGAQVLPLVRALANGADLPPKAQDLIYSDLLGRVLVAYPVWAGWLLCAVAASLVATVLVLVRRRALAHWSGIARGALALLLMTLGAVLCLHLCGRLLGGENATRTYALVARYPLLLAGAAAIALAALIGVADALAHGARRRELVIAAALLGAACSIGGFDAAGAIVALLVIGLVFACVGRPVSLWGFWSGTLGAGLVLALLLQALLPFGSFLVQWPLLLAALVAVLLLITRIDLGSARGAVLLFAMAAIGFAQISSWGGFFFVLMGAPLPALLALFVPLAALVLAPGLYALCVDGAARRLSPSLLATGAVLLLLVGWTRVAPHPLAQLFYFADPAAQRFERISATKDLDDWSRAALSLDGGEPAVTSMKLLGSGTVWTAKAAPSDVPPPRITIEHRAAADGHTDLLLRVQPGAAGRELKLLMQPTEALTELTLNGRKLDTLEQAAAFSLNRTGVIYTAPAAEGIVLTFRAPTHGKLDVTALEISDGWPDGVQRPSQRPSSLLTWGLGDTTVAQSMLQHDW
jgi:Peptidase family M28